MSELEFDILMDVIAPDGQTIQGETITVTKQIRCFYIVLDYDGTHVDEYSDDSLRDTVIFKNEAKNGWKGIYVNDIVEAAKELNKLLTDGEKADCIIIKSHGGVLTLESNKGVIIKEIPFLQTDNNKKRYISTRDLECYNHCKELINKGELKKHTTLSTVIRVDDMVAEDKLIPFGSWFNLRQNISYIDDEMPNLNDIEWDNLSKNELEKLQQKIKLSLNRTAITENESITAIKEIDLEKLNLQEFKSLFKDIAPYLEEVQKIEERALKRNEKLLARKNRILERIEATLSSKKYKLNKKDQETYDEYWNNDFRENGNDDGDSIADSIRLKNIIFEIYSKDSESLKGFINNDYIIDHIQALISILDKVNDNKYFVLASCNSAWDDDFIKEIYTMKPIQANIVGFEEFSNFPMNKQTGTKASEALVDFDNLIINKRGLSENKTDQCVKVFSNQGNTKNEYNDVILVKNGISFEK